MALSNEQYERIMHGTQPWQIALQKYEADKADGRLWWDDKNYPHSPDQEDPNYDEWLAWAVTNRRLRTFHVRKGT